VGGAADRFVGPPHPALSPGQRRERVKERSLEANFAGPRPWGEERIVATGQVEGRFITVV
jgi:hypothetical protein